MNNQNNFDGFFKRMKSNPDATPSKLENAAKQGKLGDILKGVDKKKLAQVQQILQNKEETERILNSPQAKELMKRLKKDKGAD